jgi:Cu-Zn family superoxide dismutase
MKKAICILSKNNGIVNFSQCCPKHSVTVTFNLKNFEKNTTRAIHCHEYGDTTNGCKTLGGHYNAFNTTHGSILYPDKPRHSGDMINNFTADNNGEFLYEYIDPLLTLYGDDSILGRSIVIHDGIDDLGLGTGDSRKESLITGNAGTRLCCGIIALTKS